MSLGSTPWQTARLMCATDEISAGSTDFVDVNIQQAEDLIRELADGRYWPTDKTDNGNPIIRACTAEEIRAAIASARAALADRARQKAIEAQLAQLRAEEEARKRERARIDSTREIQTGEIIGWRVWEHIQDPYGKNGLLKSVFRDTYWTPGIPMESARVPYPDNKDGVYAFKERGSAIDRLHLSTHVYGSVKLWGEILECERGYRAEFATIASLDGFADRLKFLGESKVETHRRLNALQMYYGVPVSPWLDGFQAYVSANLHNGKPATWSNGFMTFPGDVIYSKQMPGWSPAGKDGSD